MHSSLSALVRQPDSSAEIREPKIAHVGYIPSVKSTDPSPLSSASLSNSVNPDLFSRREQAQLQGTAELSG